MMEARTSFRQSKIFAVAGGKGGVGKSVLAASMGMGLAMLHKQVTLIDADFGGANLHRILGMENIRRSNVQFLRRKVHCLEELAISHPRFNHLKLIRGMNGYLGAANLPYSQKLKMIRHIFRLPADYVILDLGGGTNYHVLDFFCAADAGIVVVTPDPLSILEAYHFIKQAFFRKLTQTFKNQDKVSEIIQHYAHEESHNRHANVNNMMTEIRLTNAALADKIQDFQKRFRPKLLVNHLRKPGEENECMAVMEAAKELLLIDVEYWGAVHDDSTVYDSVKASQPFISYNSKSRASRDLATIIITKMLKKTHLPHHEPKDITKHSNAKQEKICSVHCLYWETCEFKRGGYPCDLLHL
ncbi:P-loop NTPase [bacterium]|nr:P-loop NTPase [bacterium]